eukprot:TRINITY_DN1735_c0_g1_i1.p1 TRINITY_DN1735_c0_g1~~TRINITY_DN1735_c0_g1_i1.p1  ORF type:complete len:668 (-),score=97.09 TRINITY_DN1735_c0_g1_i1:140-2143(-)
MQQATTPLENLICSFSPNSKLLVVCSTDNRLRVFNTTTGFLQAEFQGTTTLYGSNEANGIEQNGNKLIEQIKSVTFGSPLTNDGGNHQFLACCGASGYIRVYDISDPKLEWQKRGHNSEANYISTRLQSSQGQGQEFVSVGQDGQLTVIGMNGKIVAQAQTELEKLTCIVQCQNDLLMVGTSSNLILGQIEGAKKKAQFSTFIEYPGHTLPTSCMKFLQGLDIVVSGSRGERGLTLWDVDISDIKKKKKKVIKRKASGNLDMNDYPVSIDVVTSQVAGSNQFNVLSVSSVGEVYVWQCTVKSKEGEEEGGKAKHRRKIKGSQICKIKMKINDGKNFLLAAQFESENTLKIAKGISAKPVFESISLEKGVTEVELVMEQQGLLLQPSKEESQKGQRLYSEITQIGQDHTQQAIIQSKVTDVQIDEPETDHGSRKRNWKEFMKDSTNDEDGINQADNMPDLNEPTLEEQLQKMEGGSKQNNNQDNQPNQIPKGGAVAESLKQALRANDNDLILQCIKMATGRAMHQTVAMLKPELAMQFVDQLVIFFQTKPFVVQYLTPWIKAVLQHHALHLTSSDRLSTVLSTLQQTIENRLKLQRPLLQLQGRLDLLLAQVQDDGTQDKDIQLQPTVEYDESDLDEGVEIEDPFEEGTENQLQSDGNRGDYMIMDEK